MEKQKILYVITKSKWGGAGRYVFDMATNLQRDSFDIKVALGGNGKLKDKLEESKIDTIILSSLQRDVDILKDIKVFFELFRIFSKEKPDIIHLNSSKIGGLGGFAGRVYNITNKFKLNTSNNPATIIFTAHGWAHTETHRPILQRKLIAILHWLTIIFSHKTITVSKKSREEVQHFPFISNKLRVIYNGITQPLFKDKQEARKEILTQQTLNMINNETVCIGTIAELHKNKGLSYLIEAFAKLSSQHNIILIIIGAGEEKEKLINLTKELQINERVFFIKKEQNANTVIKAFDIFALTSIKEGLPYVILEAGFAGIPIIASDIGGIREVITNNINGLLTEPGQVTSIEEGLKQMITNKESTKDYGNNIKQKVIAEFSLEKMIHETVKLYKN